MKREIGLLFCFFFAGSAAAKNEKYCETSAKNHALADLAERIGVDVRTIQVQGYKLSKDRIGRVFNGDTERGKIEIWLSHPIIFGDKKYELKYKAKSMPQKFIRFDSHYSRRCKITSVDLKDPIGFRVYEPTRNGNSRRCENRMRSAAIFAYAEVKGIPLNEVLDLSWDSHKDLDFSEIKASPSYNNVVRTTFDPLVRRTFPISKIDPGSFFNYYDVVVSARESDDGNCSVKDDAMFESPRSAMKRLLGD